MVSDRTLIDNFNILFENRIFLCGRGNYIAIAENLLQEVGISDYEILSGKPDGCSEYGDEDEGEDEDKDEDKDKGYASLFKIMQAVPEKGSILVYCDSGNQMFLDGSNIYTLMGLAFAIHENMEHEKISWDLQMELSMNDDIQNAVRRQLSGILIMQSIEQLAKRQVDVLIYQPGKVGSTTLCNSLTAGGFEAYSIHGLNPRGRYLHLSEGQIPLCEEYVEAIKKQVKKIITIIREPISRDFASYFEGILVMDDKILIPQTDGRNPVSSSYEYFLHLLENNECTGNTDGETGWYFNEPEWYNDELKPVFGIDVYRYPFDRKKGYGIIEDNGVSVLVLKAEKSQVWQEAVREFTGKEDFRMLDNANVAGQKLYAHLYQEVKETARLPQEYVDFYYRDNEKLRHFYTDEELEEFKAVWSKKVIKQEDKKND